VFVRTLQVVDEEVACREAQNDLQRRARNTRIKDRMREQCVPQLVDACLTIVESASADPELVSLARSALGVLSSFTWWVDLQLIACDRCLAMLSKFLGNEDFRVAAANNLHSIVCKQMPPEDKMPLLQRLQLLPLLQSSAAMVRDSGAAQDADFVGRLAALTAAFASECMDCSDRLHGRPGLPEEPDCFLLGCVPLVGIYVNVLDHGPSCACCLAFVQLYLNRLRRVRLRDAAAAGPHMEHVPPLINVIVGKMMYPVDFHFDQPGEDETDFLACRRDLCVLFRTAASIDETAALQCTLAAVNELHTSNGDAVPFATVEVALTLLLQLTEAAKASKGAKALEIEGAKSAREAAIAGLLVAGPEMQTQYAGQRCVVAAYLRLARGCAAVLRAQPAAVNPVLNVFFGSIRCDDPELVNDASHIFVKWLQKEGGAALTAELCFDDAFAAVLSLLQSQPSKELAEACGLLISTDIAHIQHLESVLVPVLEQLTQRIAAAVSTEVVDGVSICLAVSAFVCKGFCTKRTSGLIRNGKQEAARVVPLLQGTVEMGVKAVIAFPVDNAARSALVTLIRSVLTVTDFTTLIPWLIPAINAILVSATCTGDADGVVELLELFGGFATRYKAEIAPLMGMSGLVEAIVDISLQVADCTAEGREGEDAEQLDDRRRDARRVRHALSYLIFWVTNTGLVAPFVSDTMKARLPTLLSELFAACGTPPIEQPACKNGFATLSRLLEAWLSTGTESEIETARPFLCDQLPRLCLQTLLRPELKFDKHGVEVVNLVASMHRRTAAQYTDGFDRVLIALLGALGVPSESETMKQSVGLVHGADGGAYVAFLLELLKHSRDR
jgi:hypothetical protein